MSVYRTIGPLVDSNLYNKRYTVFVSLKYVIFSDVSLDQIIRGSTAQILDQPAYIAKIQSTPRGSWNTFSR